MIARALRVPFDGIEPGEVLLSAATARYVLRVHRLRQGDRLVVFDPSRAIEAEACIVATQRGAARIRIDAPRPASCRPRGQVTLLQAVGKGDKMDAVVRDATELGVTRIIPALATRSVMRCVDAGRVARWRRIAVEAARQCGRGDAPCIDMPLPLETAVEQLRGAADGSGICLDPSAGEPLGPALMAMAPQAHVLFVVGPEGGLDGSELAACSRSGFVRRSLGDLVLRTETVCAAVLGALLVMRHMQSSEPVTRIV